ncbi:MAG: hypothetical protein QW270_05335 [Candidatus Bathyarchaeia archaeon]
MKMDDFYELPLFNVSVGGFEFEFEVVDEEGRVLAKSKPAKKREYKVNFDELPDEVRRLIEKEIGKSGKNEKITVREVKGEIRLAGGVNREDLASFPMVKQIRGATLQFICKGSLQRQYQLLENGQLVCYSLPKLEKYPLVFYKEPDKQWLKVERKDNSYVFYDENNMEIAWMEFKRGFLKKKFKMKIRQLPKDFMNKIITIATNVATEDFKNS